MGVDELLLFLESYFEEGLNSLQEQILRSCWEGKIYENIALETGYEKEQIMKVAANLWQILSDLKHQSVNELNFRLSFENFNLNESYHNITQQANSNSAVSELEFPSGPVPIDSKFYIFRPSIEESAYAEIVKPGSVICIKAPKKMGKSSLNLRILNYAANTGYKTANLDFQQADKAIFANLNHFLRWFCANVSRELGLEARLDDYWDEEMGTKISCSLYFEAYLLSSLESPLVLVLNEVDWVFNYPDIAGEFLPLLRSWYEQAKRVDIWQKLRIVLAYSTEIIVPLKLSQSPFNVGLPLRLLPFTKQQVQELVKLHGLDWMDEYSIDKLMTMVGGHPYLIRLALYYIANQENNLEYLELLLQQASTEEGIYNSHLRQYVSILREDVELQAAFQNLITATSPIKLEPIATYKLRSMGLIKLEGDYASVACELYRLYFQDQFSNINESSDLHIEELQKDLQQLRSNSNLDELTQLINRSCFDIYLETLWQDSANRKSELSLIICDIDYFKYYNRTYGTKAGDSCLQQIAHSIREYISDWLDSVNVQNHQTFIARYAGDKFAVLTPVNQTIAYSIAQNIKEKIQALAIKSQYPGIGGLPAEVITVSVGVASILPQNKLEPLTLVNIAEQALYQAKRKGRNRVAIG